MLIPTGFWSYTTSDDTSSRGKLSQLRALLAAELQQQVGRDPRVNIFQDVAAIPPGAEWERQIRNALEEASFLIPIVTPGFLQSEWCCREVTLFREREEKLGVRNLVFPIHYVDTEHLDGADKLQCQDAEVLAFLRTRHWINFRSLRFRSQESEEVALLLENLARGILKALREGSAAEVRRREKAGQEARAAKENRDRQEAAQSAEAGEKRRAAAERPSLRAVAEAQEKRRKTEAKAVRADHQRSPASRRKIAIAVGILLICLIAGLARVASNRQSVTGPPGDVSRAADAGNATAMDRLGDIYYLGSGVPQDYVKAREWYEKAAAAGIGGSMESLGSIYDLGRGVPRDYVKAREWYEKAAVAGVSDAMDDLGSLYRDGSGVPQDYVKAREWYAKGAALGSSLAMDNLANLLEDGLGGPKDIVKARKWRAKSNTE